MFAAHCETVRLCGCLLPRPHACACTQQIHEQRACIVVCVCEGGGSVNLCARNPSKSAAAYLCLPVVASDRQDNLKSSDVARIHPGEIQVTRQLFRVNVLGVIDSRPVAERASSLLALLRLWEEIVLFVRRAQGKLVTPSLHLSLRSGDCAFVQLVSVAPLICVGAERATSQCERGLFRRHVRVLCPLCRSGCEAGTSVTRVLWTEKCQTESTENLAQQIQDFSTLPIRC